MDRTDAGVDRLFGRAGKWREAFEKLRAIVLSVDPGLTEEVKWGWPSYSYQNANVFLMHGFKDYFALLFFKGSLLKDPQGLLVQQTHNVQGARQLRFTSMQEMLAREPIIRAYIREAIDVEKTGLKVNEGKKPALMIPEELQRRLNELADLRAAFSTLTPGRQRAYCLYIGGPKQSATRQARVDKCMERILAGKGLDDE